MWKVEPVVLKMWKVEPWLVRMWKAEPRVLKMWKVDPGMLMLWKAETMVLKMWKAGPVEGWKKWKGDLRVEETLFVKVGRKFVRRDPGCNALGEDQ